MYDRNVEHPNRYQLVKVEGTDDIFDLVPAPGTVNNDGTLINKNSLLKDATAALFGMGADAVPDDALQMLSRFQKGLGNEYVWEKSGPTPAYVEQLSGNITRTIYQDSYLNNQYSKEISIDQTTGEITMTGVFVPSSVPTSNYQDYWYGLLPFYCMSDGRLRKYISISSYESTHINFRTSTVESVLTEIVTSFGYVNSPNPNAYPVDDGYTYIPIGRLGEKTRIETGSYVGTGTYGVNNPNSLTFDFAPSLLIITADQVGLLIGCGGLTASYTSVHQMALMASNYNSYVTNAKKSADGKTITWYNYNNAATQCNTTTTWHYIAIG